MLTLTKKQESKAHQQKREQKAKLELCGQINNQQNLYKFIKQENFLQLQQNYPQSDLLKQFTTLRNKIDFQQREERKMQYSESTQVLKQVSNVNFKQQQILNKFNKILVVQVPPNQQLIEQQIIDNKEKFINYFYGWKIILKNQQNHHMQFIKIWEMKDDVSKEVEETILYSKEVDQDELKQLRDLIFNNIENIINQNKSKTEKQQNKLQKLFSKLDTKQIVIFVCSILFLAQCYLWIKPIQIQLIKSDCIQPEYPSIVPEICNDINSTYYWHDPSFQYNFSQFIPCANEVGTEQCLGQGQFVSYNHYNSNHFRIPVIFINNGQQSVQKIAKFRLHPVDKQFFKNSNLQANHLIFVENKEIPLNDIQNPIIETYNFIADERFLKNETILTTTTQLSIKNLLKYKQQINIWHTFTDQMQIEQLKQLYQIDEKNVKLFYFDFEKELSEDKQLLKFYEDKMLANKNSTYVQTHIKSLMRTIIIYKYGGWFVEMPTLIIYPMVGGNQTLFTSFNDQNPVYAFSNNICYMPPRNWFMKEVLQIIPLIYNQDDYNVIDTDAPKIIYQKNLQNPQIKQIQLLSTDFYLPQVSDPQVLIIAFMEQQIKRMLIKCLAQDIIIIQIKIFVTKHFQVQQQQLKDQQIQLYAIE